LYGNRTDGEADRCSGDQLEEYRTEGYILGSTRNESNLNREKVQEFCGLVLYFCILMTIHVRGSPL